MATPTTPHTGSERTYTIQPGDDLAAIAARHGVSIQMLNAANPEQQLSVRRPVAGQSLEIPPTPMSVLAAPEGRGFNPSFVSSGSVFSASSRVDGRTASIEWNPSAGAVKGTVQAGGPLAATGGLQPTGQATVSDERAVVRNAAGGYEVGLTREVAFGGGVRESAGGATLEAARTAGTRVGYTVALPPQPNLSEAQAVAQAGRIDPFDPTTIPVGGTVRLNQQAFTGTALEASFARAGRFAPGVATQSNVVDAAGTSYAITRSAEDRVQVVIGPNRAIEAFQGVGLSTSVATAMAGRQDALGHSALQTASFDIRSPDGQAAFAHFLSTGEVARQSPGVSDVATVERIDLSSATRLRLALGPEQARLQADLAGQENTGSLVRTTYADGSRMDLLSARYGDNVPLQVVQRFDPQGNELPDQRSYRFTVDTSRPEYGFLQRLGGRDGAAESRNMAANLNAALSGDQAGEGPVRAGGQVTLAFDESQMRAMMDRVRAGDPASPQARGWEWLDRRAADGRPVEPMEFALATARRFGNEPYAFAENLRRTTLQGDGAPVAIDATALDADGRRLPVPGRERGGTAQAATPGEAVERLSDAAREGGPAFRAALDDLQRSPLGREFQARMEALAREQAPQPGRQEPATPAVEADAR